MTFSPPAVSICGLEARTKAQAAKARKKRISAVRMVRPWERIHSSTAWRFSFRHVTAADTRTKIRKAKPRPPPSFWVTPREVSIQNTKPHTSKPSARARVKPRSANAGKRW